MASASGDSNAHAIDGATSVVHVRFEYGYPTLGIGTATPRLSWQVETDDPAWTQTAYEIELDGGETVRVTSDDQLYVPWPFEPLSSRSRATVRIRLASGATWTDWSEPSTVEVGLLSPADWTARFISPRTIGGIEQPAPILSRHMTLRPGIASARLYITSHGIYGAELNGQRVGRDVLTPGWTSYTHRLGYQTYDVTSLLCAGDNTIEVVLGNGRFRGRIGRNRALYGDRLALLAQLEVIYNDGTCDYLYTDDTWSARESCILENDYYDGQMTDFRERESPVDGVEVLDEDLTRLTVSTAPPMRVTELIPAQAIWKAPSGATLVDFGQNLVGWVRLRVTGTRVGQQVTVRHAELLEDGELCIAPLLGAKATDTYLLSDSDEATLEPSLTFHGFRYAEITGLPEPRQQDVSAVVVNADLPRIGSFTCSDPMLNRLHDNVFWSVRGNFLDVPTDCPQRAERVGWTGDMRAITPTASFLFDIAGFLSSWLADLALDQHDDGSVPWVIPTTQPNEPSDGQWAAAGWADAATFVPWDDFLRSGETEVLRRQFQSMRRWVDKLASLTVDGIRQDGFQFADYVCPPRQGSTEPYAQHDKNVIATAYLVRSADIVAESAKILGYSNEHEHYSRIVTEVKRAFNHEYVNASGEIAGDTPTVYALAIEWDLLDTSLQRKKAYQRLAQFVEANDCRACTGYIGTSTITDALCTAGFPDLAYEMLFQRECPSWLYPVTMGATTLWETWNAILPDGTPNGVLIEGEGFSGLAGVSLNHYALGAVADWMHRTVAGLAPAAPGYRQIMVKPIPARRLTHARAEHRTPYGTASVEWRRSAGQFELTAVVPVGTTATVHLPGEEPQTVRHGEHLWSVADPTDSNSV